MKHVYKTIKRILSLIFVLGFLLALLPVSVFATETSANGTWGNNLRWQLNSDGVLTISGEGAMEETYGAGYPWYDLKEQIQSVVIGEGVTSIANYAFYSCGLTHVSFPDGLKSIGNNAFEYCNYLTSVTLPDSLSNYGYGAFARCNSLHTISVGSNNTTYCSIDGVLFSKNVDMLLQYPAARSGAYSIPDSVSQIAESAFWNCDEVTDVTFPSGLTSIGATAFGDCYKLTDVTLPDGLTSIGDSAFSSCRKITSINLPDSLTSIGDNAFYWCSALTDIALPDKITNIGEWAFCGCESITSVTLPSGLTSIGDQGFAGCEKLTSITFPNSLSSIGNYAFNNCDSLVEVYFEGTEKQWKDIQFGENNDPLLRAIIHCNEETSVNHPYIPCVEEAIIAQRENWGDGFGVLHDIDENGTAELVMLYTHNMDMGNGNRFPCAVCSVYTIDNGVAIQLIDKEILFTQAGGPSGYVGVVRLNNTTYFAITAETGETGGGPEYSINRYGTWKLYTIDGKAISLNTTVEYDYYRGENIEYGKSSAVINGKSCSYKEYEEWRDSLAEVFVINDYYYDEKPESVMTLDEILAYLKENPAKEEHNIAEIRAYTAFPESTIGVDQEVKIQFSLLINGNNAAIEEYSLLTSNPNVIKSIGSTDSSGSMIVTFKGLTEGTVDLTFTDKSTGATITIPLTVENKCNYFRCSAFPIPYESCGSIYIADYSCTANDDGTHNITFNAYNTSYAYGVVEVYDEYGSLIRVVPLDPRSDGSGMEKVVNGFKWVWNDIKDIFDGETPFYIKDQNAKHTPITNQLDNIPENAEIVITSDGKESYYTTLYTGVDTFVRIAFAASSIDLKTEGQVKTVKELMNALVDSLLQSISDDEVEKAIKQGLIKEASENISTMLAFSTSADSVYDIYDTVYNLFQSLDIDAEEIMLNVLKGMGYGVADAAFTTAIPQYKIVNFVDQILEIAWPITDAAFNINRGKMEIHVTKHGLQNFVANSSVTVTQQSAFDESTVLDAYIVTEGDEFESLSGLVSTEMSNFTIFNITLRESGEEVQPNEEIEVRLPVPEGADASKCVIYRVENNGTMTLLPSTIDYDYLVFKTTHLSYYAIGETFGKEDGSISNTEKNDDYDKNFEAVIPIAIVVIAVVFGLAVWFYRRQNRKK